MKLKSYCLLIAAVLLMVACEKNNNSSLSQNVEDTYIGYTVADFKYTTIPVTTANENVVIVSTSDETVSIAYTSSTWGTFTFTNAAITFANNIYTISGDGKVLMGMSADSQKEYECTIKGTISNDKKAVNLLFSIPSVMGGTTVNFLSGDAPANMLLAGSYSGYTVANFKYTSNPTTTASEKVTITANDDKTITISHISATWGTFTISNASISFADNTYSISGSGKVLMGMSADSQKEYECTIEGTISSDKSTVDLLFSVPSVMGGTTVNFLSGNAPINMLIAGIYEGTLDLSVEGLLVGMVDDSKVTIKSQDNGKAEVTLAEFEVLEGMALYDTTISDIEVTDEGDGVYSLAGIIDTTSGRIPVTGDLNGKITNGKAELTFTIKPGAMPMSILAVFTSN